MPFDNERRAAILRYNQGEDAISMPYIIDGHNLIPHVPGLSLERLDDEEELISLLEQFCRVRRQDVEVYFDRAAPGHAGATTRGRLRITFVHAGSTADNAIRQRLRKLGRSARNYRVVSSDRQVQAEVRAAGADSIASDQFARELVSLPEPRDSSAPRKERTLSSAEVDEWLALFKNQKKND
jgi:predicted RNA-binding protein with PIN domain